ncbi:hypothetical protein CBR_g4141 [Chara braunii]|uniref:ribose-phosphate diphosphokinase n=1 Tax=Chara braunii TaxID=69332 RepID=A0A388KHD9_CHABU|nr:hypothetical protein CBR_g4141 [Chara braunii]|eukprot:GBG69446.1 hypothetical protein CBR_g4141 [Chara braunii]
MAAMAAGELLRDREGTNNLAVVASASAMADDDAPSPGGVRTTAKKDAAMAGGNDVLLSDGHEEDGGDGEFRRMEKTKRYVVYSSADCHYLAERVCNELGLPLGKVIRKTFVGGESYYRIDLKERYDLIGKDVIHVCSTCTDADLLELIRLGCAYSAYGSRRRIFVIPFLGYSTMERQVLPGEVVTAKVNARLLSSIPCSKLGNVFLFVDLHVQTLLQYMEGPHVRMELYAMEVLLKGVRDHLDLTSEPFMFASADLGRPLWVESFAKRFGVDVAFVRKARDFDVTRVQSVVGSVAGKHVIIYDDMTRSGGTLIKAAQAYIDEGATRVSAVLSHLALASDEVVRRLIESPVATIIATNTHPMSRAQSVLSASDKFKIVDITPVLVAALSKLMLE